MKILPQFTTFTDAVNEQQDRALKRSMIEREMAMKAQELEIARQKVASGGDHPAAIKIVNDMQKAAAEANDPNLSSMERARAAHRYSLLNQVSKSYAVDRGMEAVVPGFYGSAEGAPTWQEAVKMPATQAMPVLSAAKAGSVQSDINEAAEIIRNQGGQIDMGAPAWKGPPPLPTSSGPGVTGIPGWDQVQAQRAAAVKSAERQAEKNVDLSMNPQIKYQEARQGEVGKVAGQRENDFSEAHARVPQLQSLVNRLSLLGHASTYTLTGRARDTFMREMGMDVPDSAVARSDYISMVDNEILPLLRQTFGAQFTENEGKSLRATLGDANASPREKDARLRSFIRTKMEEVNTQARMMGIAPPYPQQDIDNFVSSIGDTLGQGGGQSTGGFRYLGAE